MKAQALILVSLVIRRFSTAALTNTDPQVTCNNSLSGSGWSSSNCPFVPCSIAKCPRLPSAECHNDYCDGCNHKYYLQGYDVTALCDPCSTTQCPPQTVCYFDSYNAPYCAQPCSSKLPCPAGYQCRAISLQYAPTVLCLEGSCGYRHIGYCVKEEGTMTVNV